jgi:hypothetical protein
LRDVDHELGNASINKNEALEEKIIYFRVTPKWTAFQDALVEESLRSIRVVISKVPRLTQYEMFKIIYKLILRGA